MLPVRLLHRQALKPKLALKPKSAQRLKPALKLKLALKLRPVLKPRLAQKPKQALTLRPRPVLKPRLARKQQPSRKAATMDLLWRRITSTLSTDLTWKNHSQIRIVTRNKSTSTQTRSSLLRPSVSKYFSSRRESHRPSMTSKKTLSKSWQTESR